MVTEEDLTSGGGCTMQYADDVPENYTFETYIFLLTGISSINLIIKKGKKLENNLEPRNVGALRSWKGQRTEHYPGASRKPC